MQVLRAGRVSIHGYGTIPFKWVSGLTEKEKTIVRRGGIVYVPYTPRHYRQSGFKIVRYKSGRWFHREPTHHQMKLIIRAEMKR